MNLFSKDQLIDNIRKIAKQGWHSSVKKTVNSRNDGAVGNTLEHLLNLKENNLPIPNTREWELKGQREHTKSLVTLKHLEPSPRSARVVSDYLLPNFGWKHQLAGRRFKLSEKSFRATINAVRYTNRGFKLYLDYEQNKLRFIFNPNEVDLSDPEIASWYEDIGRPKCFNPEPYWGLDDLKYAIGEKIKNCFYVIAQSQYVNGHEFFKYTKLYILSDFSFNNFMDCINQGVIVVDFDARTGHNHGTKFRIKQNFWSKLYNNVETIDLVGDLEH